MTRVARVVVICRLFASWGLSRRNTFKRDYWTERHATHGTHHAGLNSEATQRPRWPTKLPQISTLSSSIPISVSPSAACETGSLVWSNFLPRKFDHLRWKPAKEITRKRAPDCPGMRPQLPSRQSRIRTAAWVSAGSTGHLVMYAAENASLIVLRDLLVNRKVEEMTAAFWVGIGSLTVMAAYHEPQ